MEKIISLIKGLKNTSKESLLLISLICSVIVGGIFFVTELDLGPRINRFIALPGQLFVAILNFISIPLIFINLLVSLGRFTTKFSGKLSLWLLLWCLISSFMVCLFSLVYNIILSPAYSLNPMAKPPEITHDWVVADIFYDIFRNLVPDHCITLFFKQFKTDVKKKKIYVNATQAMVESVEILNSSIARPNLFGILAVAMMFGITLATFKEKAKPLIDILIAANVMLMEMAEYIMWISPIGNFCLIIEKVMAHSKEIKFYAWDIFMALVLNISGLLIVSTFGMCTVYFVYAHRNPIPLFKNSRESIVTALTTASSSSCLPYTIKACINSGVNSKISQFACTFGNILNKNGTSFFIVSVACFASKKSGRSLSINQIVTICLASTAISMGTAGIPFAGITAATIVMEVSLLPRAAIDSIIVIDWLL
ncbi:excitatory amino acid transporter 1-like [Gordionus sp. m RMFG-2023]|uniref:excitatory amino acid transporter 1-like n=1 Tax=Gordionus sp. m RMFG-2023 TaxID=3053472 RepID=UPI0031FD1909